MLAMGVYSPGMTVSHSSSLSWASSGNGGIKLAEMTVPSLMDLSYKRGGEDGDMKIELRTDLLTLFPCHCSWMRCGFTGGNRYMCSLVAIPLTT